MFPSPTLSVDPRSGEERRHPLYDEQLQRAMKKVVVQVDIHKPVSVHTLRHCEPAGHTAGHLTVDES